ncbi:MAG: hypothetical protein ACXVZP_04380 [Gaiellaceae bacterium]
MKRIVDRATDFVPAVERVFGISPRILDGSRSLLVGDVKLALEAGERELWLIEMHGPLEHRLGMVEVKSGIEEALREAERLLEDRRRAARRRVA